MKPMLAAATDGTNLIYPLLASPKLDGIRCLIVNGVAMSRALKPIPNFYVQQWLSKPHLNGLDGELIVGEPTAPDVFQRTTSGVMTQKGIPKVGYHVFDTFLGDHDFAERLKVAHKIGKYVDNLHPVTHMWVNNEEELYSTEQQYLARGYEGMMLRDPRGPYKYGRSTLKEGFLLKLKRFVDAEARVIGFSPLMHNNNDIVIDELGRSTRSSKSSGLKPMAKLGSLLVCDVKTKVEFEIGTGFTDIQRIELWMIRKKLDGKLLKYKSQTIGVKDKPRFPVFLGWRDARDL